MSDDARGSRSSYCPTCGAWTLMKRPSLHGRAARTLINIAIRIIVWLVLNN